MVLKVSAAYFNTLNPYSKGRAFFSRIASYSIEEASEALQHLGKSARLFCLEISFGKYVDGEGRGSKFCLAL